MPDVLVMLSSSLKWLTTSLADLESKDLELAGVIRTFFCGWISTFNSFGFPVKLNCEDGPVARCLVITILQSAAAIVRRVGALCFPSSFTLPSYIMPSSGKK